MNRGTPRVVSVSLGSKKPSSTGKSVRGEGYARIQSAPSSSVSSSNPFAADEDEVEISFTARRPPPPPPPPKQPSKSTATVQSPIQSPTTTTPSRRYTPPPKPPPRRVPSSSMTARSVEMVPQGESKLSSNPFDDLETGQSASASVVTTSKTAGQVSSASTTDTNSSSSSDDENESGRIRRSQRQRLRSPEENKIIRFLVSGRVYPYPNCGDSWCLNYIAYIRNNHPALSMCFSHALHPFRKHQRLIVFLNSLFFTIFISFVVCQTTLMPRVRSSFVVHVNFD